MNNQAKEERTEHRESEKKGQTSQSFSSRNMMRMMNACCHEEAGSSNTMRSMRQCCRSCLGAMRWFLLVLLLLAGSALLLGYYLNPDSILVLWMVGWGIVFGLGMIAFITMRIFSARFQSIRCC